MNLRGLLTTFFPAKETFEQRLAHLRAQLARVASIRDMFRSEGWEQFALTLETEANATLEEIANKAGDPVTNRQVLAELCAYRKALLYIAELHDSIEEHAEEAIDEVERKLEMLRDGTMDDEAPDGDNL